jgi:hypothetical protein
VKTPKKPSVRRITKERDDQAIEALCFFLDRGVSLWNGEPWSTILRRRITGKYPKVKYPKTTPSIWRNRHVRVRQLAHPAETVEQSAAHVAKIWNDAGQTVQASSLEDAATRQDARDEALAWISDMQASTEPLKIATPTGVTREAFEREAAKGGQTKEWIASMLKSQPAPIPDKDFYAMLDRTISEMAKDLGASKNVKATTVD